MAYYSGLTYKRIIELAITIAKKNGFNLEYSEAIAFIDEAILRVWLDIFEDISLYTTTWPSNNQINLRTNGIQNVLHVYADSKEMVYMTYDNYREMFLGTNSGKSTIDNNIYFTILGDILYVEPGVTGVTNLIIQHAPMITAYSGATENNSPEIPSEYRILVPYKICELASPAQLRVLFNSIYKQMKKDKIAIKNRKKATGRAVFYDLFAASDDYRKGKA